MHQEAELMNGWLLQELHDKDLNRDGLFQAHPNYDAFLSALKKLRPAGCDIDIKPGRTPGAVRALVEAGVSPDAIKAIFTLLFK